MLMKSLVGLGNGDLALSKNIISPYLCLMNAVSTSETVSCQSRRCVNSVDNSTFSAAAQSAAVDIDIA